MKIFISLYFCLFYVTAFAVDVGEFNFKSCGIYKVVGLIRPIIKEEKSQEKIVDYVLDTYPPQSPDGTERPRKARTFMLTDLNRQTMVDLDLFHNMIVETEIQLLAHSNASNNVVLKKIKGVSTYLESSDPKRAVVLKEDLPCK